LNFSLQPSTEAEGATNYNPLANADALQPSSSQCTYQPYVPPPPPPPPPANLDSNGCVIVASTATGGNQLEMVLGCTNPIAANYNPCATWHLASLGYGVCYDAAGNVVPQ